MVRVEGPLDRGTIQQSLDLGAAGVMVPTVNTVEDVARVVSACFYPSPAFPTGSRSISWPIRPQLGRDVGAFLSAANDEVVLILQCETRQCYDDLEAVLAVPGIDCCFMGPVDLSHALGLAQRLGFPACFDSPDFQECLRRVVAVCRDKGVAAGNFAMSEAKAQKQLGMGFSLLATGTDVGLMAEAAGKNAAFALGEQYAQPSNTDKALPPLPPGTPSAAAASISPERLKELRRAGLAIKDTVKIGRRGAAEGLANQVRQRWNTSEIARLYCKGKHAANMKLLEQQLEAVTGGIVVHRAGGTVFLYRGDDWQPQKQASETQQQEVAEQQQQGQGQQQVAEQQESAEEADEQAERAGPQPTLWESSE
ncbi:hypothetical protein D9Q98_007452 [Chlorella vulgaris]|uniref:CRM domain-containing protein n=1 Tax=Chlorella vulgaris TaxID=3077 RepID=A0A9D4TLF8_CHLVU|nr:hypothetical protein D9Q98_007452 [Chlorella vulgaris]